MPLARGEQSPVSGERIVFTHYRKHYGRTVAQYEFCGFVICGALVLFIYYPASWQDHKAVYDQVTEKIAFLECVLRKGVIRASFLLTIKSAYKKRFAFGEGNHFMRYMSICVLK